MGRGGGECECGGRWGVCECRGRGVIGSVVGRFVHCIHRL